MGFFKDKTERLMREIAKLEPEEFLGICKILNVKLINIEENVAASPKLKRNREILLSFGMRFARKSMRSIGIRKEI